MSHGLLARSRAVTVCACLAVAVAVAGCGATGGSATVTVPDSTLSIYASHPPNGTGSPQTNDVLDAEKLALQPLNQAGDRIGKFTIRFDTLDGKELSDNARTAVENKSSIAYLGELVPGTSWVSVEITNEEDLLQVSPSDTASFLTQPTRPNSAVPGAPDKYYPSRSTYTPGETFARLVPNTAQEAKAQVQEMQAMHVTKLYIASDGQPYGATIALEVKQAATAAGITASEGPATAAGFTGSGADALFAGTNSEATAKSVFDGVAASSPHAKLFGPSALYDAAFASGLAAPAQKNLVISSPGFLNRDLTTLGKAFVANFTTTYGHAPAPVAIFGYETINALLYVIKVEGSLANTRAAVVGRFRSLTAEDTARYSVLGTYSLDHGDTNLAPFVFSRVQGGQLVPFKFVPVQG
jgi:ABC-type branched-subunit amino acid transport system substrate-binding protein